MIDYNNAPWKPEINPLLSFTQIGQAMQTVRVETYLRPQGSTNRHRTDFSRKTRRHHVTDTKKDGRMDMGST